jgi:superfamily II DNA/RNA helicase
LNFPYFLPAVFSYLPGVHSLADQLASAISLNQVTIPDLWQSEAVRALRARRDVVVQAPTGAGKTLIFELWSNQGKNRGQAIYTVPTRALANDKLAEWRARGWNVGIATGDLADNLTAPILVATLETQKNRLIRGDGPALLVVDEYQMIGDENRGLNYELAIALAPPQTQLLLLSGSVANPQQITHWLERLGRKAVLIRNDERPVPLEEVRPYHFDLNIPSDIKGYWPRFAAKALAANLGPILIFAPRRQAAEKLAAELSRFLPNPNPLSLREDQKQLVDEPLAKLLQNRIAYHHSGLSYGARAGLIEPLAKAGQLRVVVATMGLAAGINFSLRSVALAGDSYRRDYVEQPLKADEILQMFGRAGRRGIDETGYVLVSANGISLREAYPTQLSRSGLVDWSALLGLMSGAAAQGQEPFAAAVKVQERLFTTKPIFLGVEQSLKNPDTPCGLKTDPERARHIRKKIKQMRNSRGEWELMPPAVERALGDIRIVRFSDGEPEAVGPRTVPGRKDFEPAVQPPAASVDSPTRTDRQGAPEPGPVSNSVSPAPNGDSHHVGCGAPFGALPSILTEPAALERIGHGSLVVLHQENGLSFYGRALTVGERPRQDQVLLAKWARRLLGWKGRQTHLEVWKAKVIPLLEEKLASQQTPVVRFEDVDHKIRAWVSLADLTMRVPVDRYGVPLWRPPERNVLPQDCAVCTLRPACRQLSTSTGVAMLWRRLGLVDKGGTPTTRGRVVSFFSQEDGLAIAAGLEDPGYPLEDMVYDLANLDAGFRFCGQENRWAGRLIVACHELYGYLNVSGYLENGAPPRYGSGAEQIVASIHKSPLHKSGWIRESLGAGDIDRVIIEWRSLLRQAVHAPDLDWPRWMELKKLAKSILNETQSPTLIELPPLDYSQSKRIDHRLRFRRY